jgi:hypothetical protein
MAICAISIVEFHACFLGVGLGCLVGGFSNLSLGGLIFISAVLSKLYVLLEAWINDAGWILEVRDYAFRGRWVVAAAAFSCAKLIYTLGVKIIGHAWTNPDFWFCWKFEERLLQQGFATCCGGADAKGCSVRNVQS